MRRNRVALAGAGVLALALSACEQPSTSAGDAVVAKVGRDLIGEAELTQAVSRLGPMGEAESTQARGKVLEALVDQYLVSNAARSAKLDKSPKVALALQQAQRQVLVEAYMEHLFQNIGRPGEAEIRDYYARHPELFGERRLYRLQELELQLAPSRTAEVEAQLKRSGNLAEFSAWLESQGISGRAGVAVRPAEQIPPAVLERLTRMQDGEVAVLQAADGRVSVLQRQGSRPQPVSFEQARDAIERILLAEKRKTLMEAEIRKLRASGKVEYASGFEPAAAQSGRAGQP